jgi:hypothetical protein
MGANGVEDTHRALVGRHHQKIGDDFVPDLLTSTGDQITALPDIMTSQQVPIAEMAENTGRQHQNERQESAALARFQSDWLLRKL